RCLQRAGSPYAHGFLPSYYFFFQAEDGIRDFHVTGVQTCALPIYAGRGRRLASAFRLESPEPESQRPELSFPFGGSVQIAVIPRSEERRVGKEWRSRRSPSQDQKVHTPGSVRERDTDY